MQGLQVPTNLSEAVKLYEKAVDAGDIDAQNDMGAACLRDHDPAQRARVRSTTLAIPPYWANAPDADTARLTRQ